MSQMFQETDPTHESTLRLAMVAPSWRPDAYIEDHKRSCHGSVLGSCVVESIAEVLAITGE